MNRLLAVAVLVAALWPLSGCPHNGGDSVVVTGDGTRLSSEAIDRDPLSLFPAEPVAMGSLDARAFLDSSFGAQFAQLASSVLPLGQDTGFSLQRDVRRAYFGVYVAAGINPVGVVQGDFAPDLIRAAADRQSITPLGVPVVHSRYAGNDVYTAANQGFSVLTKHSVLVGEETGIRRAMDRIRDNRLRRELPDWMVKLMDNPEAALVVGADLSRRPEVLADLARQWSFLNGLSSVRILGNFQPPGINLAGALTYADQASATRAAESLKALGGMNDLANTFKSFGIGTPLQSLKVQLAQQDVDFTVVVAGDALSAFLGSVLGFMKSRATAQAPGAAR